MLCLSHGWATVRCTLCWAASSTTILPPYWTSLKYWRNKPRTKCAVTCIPSTSILNVCILPFRAERPPNGLRNQRRVLGNTTATQDLYFFADFPPSGSRGVGHRSFPQYLLLNRVCIYSRTSCSIPRSAARLAQTAPVCRYKRCAWL